MRGLKDLRFGIIGIAAVAAVAGGLLIGTQVWAAVQGTLGVGSATIVPGGQGTVSVTASVPSPGLGSWTVDVIVQDPTHVSVVSCTAAAGSVCNPNYPGSLPTVRFAGATATGIVGDTTLGTITVRCASSEGSSTLNLSTVGMTDATIGSPTEIAVTMSPGTISCAAAATPAPSPTSAAAALPATGAGGSNGGSSFGWLIAALAGSGLAGIAGCVALRLRTRRW